MQYDAIPRILIIFVGGLKLLVVTAMTTKLAAFGMILFTCSVMYLVFIVVAAQTETIGKYFNLQKTSVGALYHDESHFCRILYFVLNPISKNR